MHMGGVGLSQLHVPPLYLHCTLPLHQQLRLISSPYKEIALYFIIINAHNYYWHRL
jgi:hypothetical protein